MSSRPSIKATCAAVLAASFAVGGAASPESLGSIERYCVTSWRQAGIPPQEWDDCTQETIAELLARLPQDQLPVAVGSQTSEQHRELMRSVWCVVKRWQRGERRHPRPFDAPEATLASAEDRTNRLEAAELIAKGLDQLSTVQRQILERWSHGESIADISMALDISPARVSDQKYKALRTMRQALEASQVA